MDDIVCTVKGIPLKYIECAMSFQKITIQTPKGCRDLAFVDLNINVNNDRRISCHWYQKLTDTGIILNFRSCASLQHKKNVIQGNDVQRKFKINNGWQSFEIAHTQSQEIG